MKKYYDLYSHDNEKIATIVIVNLGNSPIIDEVMPEKGYELLKHCDEDDWVSLPNKVASIIKVGSFVSIATVYYFSVEIYDYYKFRIMHKDYSDRKNYNDPIKLSYNQQLIKYIKEQ